MRLRQTRCLLDILARADDDVVDVAEFMQVLIRHRAYYLCRYKTIAVRVHSDVLMNAVCLRTDPGHLTARKGRRHALDRSGVGDVPYLNTRARVRQMESHGHRAVLVRERSYSHVRAVHAHRPRGGQLDVVQPS